MNREDLDWLLEQRQSTTLQTLILSKERFKTASEARSWAADHDFRTDKLDETDESFRFRQRQPGEFQDGSFRTIEIDSGVKAVVGRLKQQESRDQMRDETIFESFERGQAFREAHVDRSSNVIQNVTLLGKVSKNGRSYSEQAMEDAVRLYQGTHFFIDHPKESDLRDRRGARSVFDLAGKVISARRVGDRVRGDLQLLDREPTKSLVFALAEQMPEAVGNSHRATGDVRTSEDGQEIVERLTEVAAVELVTDPATTSGLFESLDRREGEVEKKDITLEWLEKELPDLLEQHKQALESGSELEALRKENQTLKEEREKAKREKLIAEKLKAAKLPDAVVSDLLREQLEAAKDEATVDLLIEDRKKLAGQLRSSVPKSTERDFDRTLKEGSEQYKPLEECDLSGSGLRIVREA